MSRSTFALVSAVLPLILGAGELPTEETEVLGRCIEAHSTGEAAKDAADKHCRRELSAWWRACLRPPNNQCREKLDTLVEVAEERRMRATSDPAIEALSPVQRFFAGVPLAGLPDLRAPVFLRRGALFCRSPGALKNPNVDITSAIGACKHVGMDVQVRVYEPDTLQEYVQASYTKAVRVLWGPTMASSASYESGWVNLTDLNGRRWVPGP